MKPLQTIDKKIIDKDYSTLIVSKEVMQLIKEELGDKILWDYDEETQELILIPKPKSYTEALTGLGEEMWKKAGGVKYIQKERDSWET